jgi:hypothetical protein
VTGFDDFPMGVSVRGMSSLCDDDRVSQRTGHAFGNGGRHPHGGFADAEEMDSVKVAKRDERLSTPQLARSGGEVAVHSFAGISGAQSCFQDRVGIVAKIFQRSAATTFI